VIRRFTKEHAVGPRGFSAWKNPKMRGYLMACCDCGLVHEMEFKAFRITKRFADGSYSYDELPRTEYGVTMRARRAARYTSQLRRKG
jgi:hypothetical protein